MGTGGVKRLSNLQAREVSLVKRGANRRPFLIYKAEETDMPEGAGLAERLQIDPESNQRIDARLAARAEPVAKDDQGLAPLDERARVSLKAVYRILLPVKDQITRDDALALLDELGLGDSADDTDPDDDDAAEPEDMDPEDGTDQALDKGADTPTPTATAGDDMADKDDMESTDKAAPGKMTWSGPPPADKDKDKHASAMRKAQAAYKACWADSETKKDADDDDEEDGETSKGVRKSADAFGDLSRKTREHLEGIIKSADEGRAALVRKSVELEKQLHDMKQEQVLKSLTAKVRSEFQHLPMDVDKTARVLKRLAESDQEAHDHYWSSLKQADTHRRVAKSFGQPDVYGVVGASPGAGGHQLAGSSTSDAQSRIEAEVNSRVQKSDGKSYYDCYAEFMTTDEGLRLYEQMSVEQGRGG